jgi:geranylgeranyl diphosphate synthase type II
MATETRWDDTGREPFQSEVHALRQQVESRLAVLLEGGGEADRLALAMCDATLGAGKRMRPLLLMLVARDLGCTTPAVVDVACAVEMVHAASLVLDDLPCMDNATLRRGKPAVHVQFGQDVAILAAIALLSRAFGVLSAARDVAPQARARLVARLAETVGASGLVRGQFLDLHPAAAGSAEAILATNELKTGVLLGVTVDMAAILAGAGEPVARSLRAFALAAGQAFQIRDDFLDLPGNDSTVTGKDTGLDLGKATLMATFGADEARRRLAACLHEAERHLEAAVGTRQRTRRFMRGLFARGEEAVPSAPPAPVWMDGAASAVHVA